MRIFLSSIIVMLFFGNNQALVAQETSNIITDKKKNSFQIGINYALNGTGDEASCLYRNEYIRALNKYFDAGAGIGFFNYADSFKLFYPYDFRLYSKTSIITFDFILYIKIIDLKRHFIRFGIGYSVRKVSKLHDTGVTISYDELGQPIFHPFYELIDGVDSGVIAHLEYGLRITPHFATSISGRYYSEGKYISLSMAGINFYYSF